VFTGIVEELGELVLQDGGTLRIRASLVASDLRPGDSVAVNGVCLTAVTVDGDAFTVDVMDETWKRTALGGLTPGEPVNLERAVTPTTRLGGHLVQGHVDGVGAILDAGPDMRVGMPPELARYVAEKGSIAVDGVSLTVVEVANGGGGEWFRVGLIPTTLRLTTLGRKQAGDPVNLEVDVIAKYVERLVTGVRS
jgi:riboflavin synthase